MRKYEKINTLFARDMESVVFRPTQELKDRRGERIIVKIKWEDMKELI